MWQVKQDEIDELVYLEDKYCRLVDQTESGVGNYKASILLQTHLLGVKPQSCGLQCAQAFVVKVRHWQYMRKEYRVWIFRSICDMVIKLKNNMPLELWFDS